MALRILWFSFHWDGQREPHKTQTRCVPSRTTKGRWITLCVSTGKPREHSRRRLSQQDRGCPAKGRTTVGLTLQSGYQKASVMEGHGACYPGPWG